MSKKTVEKTIEQKEVLLEAKNKFGLEADFESQKDKTVNIDETKNLTLKNLIDFLVNYKEGKRTEDDYKIVLKNLNIKTYLPLLVKTQIMMGLANSIKYNLDRVAEMKTVELELKSVFIVLLAYTDVKVENVEEVMDFEIYDLFMETGLVDDIKKVCEKDYNNFMKMIEKDMDFESVEGIINLFGSFDFELMKTTLENSAKFLQEFPKDKLEDLKQIATIEDPLLNKISQLVKTV